MGVSIAGASMGEGRRRMYAVLMLCAPGLFTVAVFWLLDGRGYALTTSEQYLMTLASWARCATPVCLVPALVLTWRSNRRREIGWIAGALLAVAIAVGLFVTSDLLRNVARFVFPPPMDSF
jgi:hypothetical protein